MTKSRVGVSSRNWFRDPRSQKRDLGHPSISPFDVAEGTSFVISLTTRLRGCDFFSSVVVCGRKALKSICQEASPGSFDCAHKALCLR